MHRAHKLSFSSGIELAPFVTSTGLLRKSWDVVSSRHTGIISNVGVGLSWKVYKDPGSDLTIIAFEPTSDSSHLQPDLVSSSDLKDTNFPHFDFLCTERNPFFSVNCTAATLFRANQQKLDNLKSEIYSSTPLTPLLVTGNALGGSVASLFTISLLDSKNRPLCITFGSPLIGDEKLQEAISRSSNWNSCFLHVVSVKDPLPRFFITNPTSAYTPFGTFLLCSNVNSTCFENPDSILEILVALGSIHVQNQGFQSADYGNIVENLNHKVICTDFTTRGEDMTHPDSLASCISLQLKALGLTPHMLQQQKKIDINILHTNIKTREEKCFMRSRFGVSPSRLNHAKMSMAQLEWYKRETKNRGIGYYDSYKKFALEYDWDVVAFHKLLTLYWKRVVEEAGMKPRRGSAAYRTRWVYAGTNYRRMVEPLAIADYYREGGKDYVTKGRSEHFKRLEGWLMDGTTKVRSNLNWTNKKNVEAILTIDSCFWAHVEEALLSCKGLEDVKQKEEALTKLLEFEEYVYGLLKNYTVSPEIFLAESSYMHWWDEYKAIKGTSYNSTLANFMNDATKREQYALGAYDFP